MGILIDTNILIEIEKERVSLPEIIRGREDEAVFISVITASELLHGVWRAIDPHIRAKRSAFVEGVLERFPILPINLLVARKHAEIWANLKSKGTSVGLHDSWIAATCLAYNHALMTNNVQEFNLVEGLTLEWI